MKKSIKPIDKLRRIHLCIGKSVQLDLVEEGDKKIMMTPIVGKKLTEEEVKTVAGVICKRSDLNNGSDDYYKVTEKRNINCPYQERCIDWGRENKIAGFICSVCQFRELSMHDLEDFVFTGREIEMDIKDVEFIPD